MKVRYQDEAQKILLTGYADTVIVDSQFGRLAGIRVGGYPEVVSGLSAAICGGGTVTISMEVGSILCTAERGKYRKTVSREGAYAVAAIRWEQDRTQQRKEEQENDKTKEEKKDGPQAEHYLLCRTGDKEALYHEIDRVSTIPMLPQFADYLIDGLRKRGILTPCMVRTTAEPFEAWRLTCTPDDQNIADVLAAGLKAGAIRIPGTQPGQPDAFAGIDGVAGYLRAFGPVIASRIRGQFQPLYDPAAEPLSEEVLKLNRFVEQTAGYSLYDAQLAAAEALRRRLQTAKFGLLIAECGSGKSKVGSLALQAYFLQKRRKCLHIVLCPSHMTGKWVRELEEAIPNARAAIVQTPSDMDALYAEYACGSRTVFAVLSKESARDGYMRRPAVHWNERRRGFICPDCGSIVQMPVFAYGKQILEDATPEFFRTETRANRKCADCGAVLWTATTAEAQSEWVRISHLGYVHRRFAHFAQFAREYGVTEDTYEVTEGGYNSNRRTAKRKKRSRQKPGVSPLVYSRFLLENGVFLSLMDMGKDLPEYEEIPVPLRLPEQQAAAYRELENAFRRLLRDRSREGRKLAQALLSVFLNLMMAYPDQPYGHKPVVHPVTRNPLVVPQSSGAPDEETEKDRRTLDIIRRKVSAGERVLLYVNWVRLDSRTRLKRFLTDAGIRAEILSDTVPPRKREEWVEDHLRQGMQVMITNPGLVETGLDLNDFTTLIFYDMAFKLFTFRQASRRSWRINQTAPRVEVYILYYRHTMQERAIRLMASKLAVAGVIEGGVLTDEGLAAMSESEDMMSALARELAEGIRHEDAVEDIAASFRKMAVLHPAQSRPKAEERKTRTMPLPIKTAIPAVQPLEQLSLWEPAG